MVSGNVKLALSIKNNPGSFALLIGSGVSTEAGIPTGRGVIEDLIVDISHAEGEEIETDPVEWYEEKYEQEPQYDDLMEKLGGTREERRSLLQGYFEPTSKEREKGEKLPTRAHQSIAWLVDQGFIDVIVTTNFDRLIETSLEQMGSPPLVISTDQDAQSPERIVHENSVLVKPNGDYKQVNLKNLNNEYSSSV